MTKNEAKKLLAEAHKYNAKTTQNLELFFVALQHLQYANTYQDIKGYETASFTDFLDNEFKMSRNNYSDMSYALSKHKKEIDRHGMGIVLRTIRAAKKDPQDCSVIFSLLKDAEPDSIKEKKKIINIWERKHGPVIEREDWRKKHDELLEKYKQVASKAARLEAENALLKEDIENMRKRAVYNIVSE